MKRTLIGGILSTIGAIGDLVIILFIGTNLVDSWSTPPGRFYTTISELGMMLPIIIATTLLVLGLVILAVEYFREDG